MNNFEEVVTATKELITSTWALSALNASFESGVLKLLSKPQTLASLSAKSGFPAVLLESLLGVLVALGFVQRERDLYVSSPGMLQCLGSSNYEWLLAKLRSAQLQTHSFVQDAKRGDLRPGWRHRNPEILCSQGRLSSVEMAKMFENRILPRLDGLSCRLATDTAHFLDIGTGVGCLALAMASRWPCLRVVAMEPFGPPLAEARRNFENSPLSDRIELRPSGLEELIDERLFDLVWLPQMFVPGKLFRQGLGPVWRALRPGGWIWLSALNESGTKLRFAISQLRNVVWGGDPIRAADLKSLLCEARFTEIQEIENSSVGEHVFIVARRPENRGLASRSVAVHIPG